jgi:hypothetical protein
MKKIFGTYCSRLLVSCPYLVSGAGYSQAKPGPYPCMRVAHLYIHFCHLFNGPLPRCFLKKAKNTFMKQVRIIPAYAVFGISILLHLGAFR